MTDPADWLAAGKEYTWRGHRIFYRDAPASANPFAQSPTLVLIHGFPTSSWDWQAIWPDLSKCGRVVALDLLGFGFSDKPADFDYRIEQQTDLVNDWLMWLGIADAHVIVHDYGVSIGQELLHRQRLGQLGDWRINSMLFLNGGLFPETHRARFIQKLLASPMGWLIARIGNERMFRRSFSAVFGPNTQPSDAELSAFWQLISRQQGHHRFHQLIGYMADRRRRREDWVEALRQSPVPIRLVNGLEDPVSGAHLVARYREVVGAVDCVELPGIGHYPQCEAPAAVAQAIAQWIAQCVANQALTTSPVAEATPRKSP